MLHHFKLQGVKMNKIASNRLTDLFNLPKTEQHIYKNEFYKI